MGTTKQRNFAPEYKAAAVERLNEPGASYGSVSADLGITSTQLKTWHLEQAAAGSETALACRKADAEELTRLRREVKRLSEENEILQKASALALSLGPMALWRPTSRARRGRHEYPPCFHCCPCHSLSGTRAMPPVEGLAELVLCESCAPELRPPRVWQLGRAAVYA